MAIQEPTDVAVDPDESAWYTIRTAGSGEWLHLRLQNIPGPLQVAFVDFDSGTIRAGESTRLRIRPNRNTASGDYQFYVLAENDAHLVARSNSGVVAMDNGIFGCPSGWRRNGDFCEPIPLGTCASAGAGQTSLAALAILALWIRARTCRRIAVIVWR